MTTTTLKTCAMSNASAKCSKTTVKMSREDAVEATRRRALWRLSEDGKSITRAFVAKDWRAAMKFLNDVSAVAEEEGHHPDVKITNYRDVEVALRTHAIDGLSNADFDVAEKIDATCEATYSPKWAREHGLE